MVHLQFADYEAVSAYTATLVVNALRSNPNLVLCMASGHSPARTCEILSGQLPAQHIDLSAMTFIGLDEWVALPPSNPGSCRYFFDQKLFQPLQLTPEQCFLFNGVSGDLQGEIRAMDTLIGERGIDLAIVGIGMNGHIGFNEPGTPFDIGCHVASLDDITKTVGQKYFSENTVLEKGITVGLGHLMNARHLVLIADGERKADVIRQALEGPVDPAFPASMVQRHPNATVITDHAAASLTGKS